MSDDKTTPQEKAASPAEEIAASSAHDEATKALHAEASRLGITPAALVQQVTRQNDK